MATITFADRPYACEDSETVLDCLNRHGVHIPSSCRSGVCQTCLVRAVKGIPLAESQNGIKDTLKLQNYFLACSCRPSADMEIALPDTASTRAPAVVEAVEPLGADIVCLTLRCENPVAYRAGQFINLFRDEHLGRSYSLASVPALDPHLHLHVRKIAGGRVSGWVHDQLTPGDRVNISDPAGNCFYVAGRPEQPLLLIGTGSGLAPLYGIARDALAQGHTGRIRLYHGSRGPEGLYLVDALRELAARHDNFHYVPCVSSAPVPAGHARGRALDVALADTPKLNGWRVFLCGHPEMVKAARRQAFLAGVSMQEILADAFTRAA